MIQVKMNTSKINIINKAFAFIIAAGLGIMSGCNTTGQDSNETNKDSMKKVQNAVSDKDEVPDVSSWPERPRLAVK